MPKRFPIGARATARTNKGQTVIQGTVIDYCDHPMVLIRNRGNKTWWPAHLCQFEKPSLENHEPTRYPTTEE